MTLYDRPRLQVQIGEKDLTERADSIVFSSTDSGGFEICTLGLPAVDRPKKGQLITIRQGLGVAWQGRVAEIADHSQHGKATKTTGGEGLRALLRDTNVQMVYVDRDLSRWGPGSVPRQINLLSTNNSPQSPQVGSDASTGAPALITQLADTWAAPNKLVAEAWYDAGPGNLLAKLYYSLSVSPAISTADAAWFIELFASTDNIATATSVSGVVTGAIPVAQYFFFSATATRYAFLQQFYNTTPGGVAGTVYNAYWKGLAAYGNHGLTGRGADPAGFYPSDVARHALSQCSGISAGNIQDAAGYIAPHVVYRTPTPADTIIDDMAKLMGWTWGIWEPATVLGSGPRLDFRPPPTDATCVVSKAECDQLDITSRLGDLYDSCTVTFTDPASGLGSATVTIPNPQLYEAGISGRELLLDMGQGSQAAATTFANFALALAQVGARGAGQATLPVNVRLTGGGSKPACLIRPGIDRIRIIDLVDGGPMLDLGTSRRDVFRISRAETTVAQDGSPSTRVELDSGTNLLETLQARQALAAGVVGAGASGG